MRWNFSPFALTARYSRYAYMRWWCNAAGTCNFIIACLSYARDTYFHIFMKMDRVKKYVMRKILIKVLFQFRLSNEHVSRPIAHKHVTIERQWVGGWSVVRMECNRMQLPRAGYSGRLTFSEGCLLWLCRLEASLARKTCLHEVGETTMRGPKMRTSWLN